MPTIAVNNNLHLLVLSDSSDDFLKHLNEWSRIEKIHTSSTEKSAISILADTKIDIAIIHSNSRPEDIVATINSFQDIQKSIPIIVVTENSKKSVAFDLIRSGAQDCIAKMMLNKDYLVRSIEYALERSNLKAELERANKLATIGVLFANIAHELNNPLTIVQSYAEMISRNTQIAESTRDKTDKILKNTKRMGHIVAKLLSYARGNTEKWEVLDLNEMINEAIEFLKDRFGSQNIHMNYTSGGITNPTIWGDQTQIQSILQNLMSNSRDAYLQNEAKSGDINIDLKNGKNGDYEIHIADKAGGMNKDVLTNLFEPFYTTKDIGKGTGLGMAIVKSFVENHKGKVTVNSVENDGTSFVLHFPKDRRATPRKTDVSTVKSTKKLAKQTDEMKILVIDDEPDFCECIEAILGSNFKITSRFDVIDAINDIETEKFDLILTDLKMPKASGIEIILRAKESQSDTPIIMITGCLESQKEIEYALKCGVKGVLRKPFESRELNHLVSEILD